jgi:uncharacterized repeat protein (TIGR03803 family)
MLTKISRQFWLWGFIVAHLTAPNALAGSQQVIHTFTGADGQFPEATLVQDASGRLYGTTANGGNHSPNCGSDGCGVVFVLSPQERGAWRYQLLYAFTGGDDGWWPVGKLAIGAGGTLYGTTQFGGPNGQGTVFRLEPEGGGPWTESVIHTFGFGLDGTWPQAGLTLDATGKLYGTTSQGAGSTGVAYKLTPNLDGSWTEEVLYAFGSAPFDPANPASDLVFDTAGNLYGTSRLGGNFGHGTVFELSPGSGLWSETVLYSFSGRNQDEGDPQAAVRLDSSGNIYGTTSGEASAKGVFGNAFKLVPHLGAWQFHTLHLFGFGDDGITPMSGLTPDRANNLYGTTLSGGANGTGTVYQLIRGANGAWTEKVVFSFPTCCSGNNPGGNPYSGVTIGQRGALFTAAAFGGSSGAGEIYKITQ